MAEPKRYWWLKLQKDFFKSKRIKKLRRLAGGDTYTIIYLKMQLLSLQDDGLLYYSKLEDTFAEEIALDIDEEPENVAVTIQYLLSVGLLETEDDEVYTLPFVTENIGSETQTAVRVRKHRENQKALQCNATVTEVKQICNVEKEIEKELEIEKDSNRAKSTRFVPPTLEELTKYIQSRGNKVNPEKFMNFYESKGWMVGKNKMKDWKAAVRSWENSDKKANQSSFNAFSQRTTDYDALLGGNT